MVSSSDTSDASRSSTLKIGYSISKAEAVITDNEVPMYKVDFRLKAPHVVVTSPSEINPIGTGSVHTVRIDSDYEIHGRKGTLKALKRFKSRYSYLSHAFSDTDSPVPMTWTGDMTLKKWNFVCLDERKMPVAKLSLNIWATKKVGNIEFLGSRAAAWDARDELVVTGVTLFLCLSYRANSLLSFFGAFFAQPGPIEQDAETVKSTKT